MKVIMHNALLVSCLVFACSSAFATLQYKVADVDAHQRYPWNGKVDIDFLIDCADASADFNVTVECKDHVGNTNIVMKTITCTNTSGVATSFTLKAGRHRLTWDADADMPNRKLPKVSFAIYANYLGPIETAEYLVINLSGGSTATSYPVSTRSGAPSGGWTSEYKTMKLVLRRCPAGTDPLGRYTLTKDFYVGIFEVTQKQWYLVMGTNKDWTSSKGKGDSYPAYDVSYDDVRGSSMGASWPSSSEVDSASFIGKLRAKTGLQELDLPTQAQWEYACRAGTTTTYNTGDGETALANAGWYSGNASNTTHIVGSKMANAWGIYDMHGNVYEWCLDWSSTGTYVPTGSDPVGAESGVYRRLRGGAWFRDASNATSSWSYYSRPDDDSRDYFGFRIFRTMP